jgi:hypothetical protein
MIVAKEKIKTNIGEYLLYMFQIEDLIRACNLDKDIIETNIISQYQADDETRNNIKDWYFGLLELMIDEQLDKKGHLSFITNKINEVLEFHQYMLQSSEHQDYQVQYKKIEPIVEELKPKQKNNNDVDIMLNAIYGVYLLKLKKQEIAKDTLVSAGKLSVLLGELSAKFKEYESGEIKIE